MHIGDLIKRTGLDDPAVAKIVEISQDIDLKDSKFGSQETPRIEQLVTGIAMAHKDEEFVWLVAQPYLRLVRVP